VNRRLWIAVVAAAALAALAVLGWLWWRSRPVPPPEEVTAPPEAPEEPPRLDLAAATFADLPGWTDDHQAAAVAAFRRSCAAWARRPADRPLATEHSAAAFAGTVADWRGVCAAAADVPRGDDRAARTFFETRFAPLAASDRDDRDGFFTGYFEPTLDGSRRRTARYRVPLYRRPPELVSVDLGQFRDDLAGRRIAGRVRGDRLEPYPARGAIDAGALSGRGLELVWVDDPVDAFFLHVQGSGVVRLAGGGEMRVGYAAQNGHPYRSIGRELVDRGELALEDVSLQSIRHWLLTHPDEAADLMAANPSFVFFRQLDGEGPVGSQGVVLTAGRSLAVDPAFHALGVPLWIDGWRPSAQALAATEEAEARSPAPGPTPGASAAPPEPDAIPADEDAPFVPAATDVRLRRLLVAQDTGGAIRGPLRGDVFWGPGDDAEMIAGSMRHPGRLWLLLPRRLADRALESPAPAAAAAPLTAR
jgi:membrane-bound lytic murein transglycosylase A